MTGPILISIVDDDESVRESLPDLIRQFGFTANAYASAEAFLASDGVRESHCLILDVNMPGMSGPDLQMVLAAQGLHVPIVFITVPGPLDVCTELLARGAIECLFKPFSQADLLSALTKALGKDRR